MGHKLFEFESLKEGILLKRYKRFLADIKLDDGRIITAHCPNTGPMKGLISENARVRVSFSPSLKRKLSWTWEQVRVIGSSNDQQWVGINTLLANKLVRKAIEHNLLIEIFGEINLVKQEVTYGVEGKSRIDLLLLPKSSNPDNRNIYVEVKNTTWVKKDLALFPDTVTTRGQKHLNELVSILPSSKAVLIPCIAREDVDYFSTGDEADPLYGELFRKSLHHGLIVIPCCFGFKKDYITWEGFRPVLKGKM